MEIKLKGKKGEITLVSEEDYEMVSKYKWYINEGGYVQCTSDKSGYTLIHRLIKNAKKNEVVDHINGNKVDNRRENLRLTVTELNNENKKISKNKISSKYKGVFKNKKCKKYHARTSIGGKNVLLGWFSNEKDAAEAFDMFIVHTKKDHVTLNFPDKKKKYLKRKFVMYDKKRSSNFIGVKKRKNTNTYISRIMHNNKDIYIKASTDPIICAKAYDKYIVDHNIPSKKLNFSEDYPNFCVNKIKIKYKSTDNENIIRLIINSCDEDILIDKEDYDKIKYYTSYMNKKGYVVINVNKKSMRLHRYILGINNPNILIDHVDKNKLNNTKKNLRISNSIKNGQNKSKRKNASSMYYGVRYQKETSKWLSFVGFSYRNQHIGTDTNEIDSARRRDLYILNNYPDEHYNLNFEWIDNDIKQWKEKLNVSKDPRFNLPYSKQILNDVSNIIGKLSVDNLLQMGKMNSFLNKKINSMQNRHIKLLNFD